jgi:hypothetical protein
MRACVSYMLLNRSSAFSEAATTQARRTLLPTAYGLRPIAYDLLPTAYCLLPTVYCLLPI